MFSDCGKRTFGNIRIGADIREGGPHFSHNSRYDNQMAIFEVIHFTDYSTQLVSVDFGKDQVEEYDVWCGIGEQVKGRNTVSGDDHIVPGRFQLSSEVFEKNPVIVY